MANEANETKPGEKKKEKTIILRDRNAIEHGQLKVKAAVAPDRDGFRRGKIWFPRGEDTIIPADTLSQERYDLITNEPMLVVLEADRVEAKKK